MQQEGLRELWLQYCHLSETDEEKEEIYRLIENYFRDHSLVCTEEQMKEICNRLSKLEPIQYILGECWFYNRAFKVSGATLIPRPETEELCHLILKEFGVKPLHFLDVGTGSGCIAVTLAAERKNWTGEAIDISSGALHTAIENAKTYGVLPKVHFKEIDFLNNTNWNDNYFDLIVSNPPYIGIEEKGEINERVLNWEPIQALFPTHHDATIFYKKLHSFLQTQQVGCTLWAEINPLYADEMKRIFGQCDILTDMYGKERFIRVEKQKGV